MKEHEIERLLKIYKEGNTTLKEEEFLFDSPESSNEFLNMWAKFVKKNKKVIPNNFNDTLWESFQKEKLKKKKVIDVMVSVAASVLLLFSVHIINENQKKINYSQKEALLKEALDMFSNTTPIEQTKRVFYEDDIIILYTSK